MKNGLIFSLLLSIFTLTALLVTRGPQEAVVEGCFAEGIRPEGHTAYLTIRKNGERCVLDSVKLVSPTFTLRGPVPRRGDSCRVEFSGSRASLPVLLRPNTTLKLRIAAEMPAIPEVIYLRAPDNDREADTLDRLPYSERMQILMQRAAPILDRK